jgi:hypothetical protein
MYKVYCTSAYYRQEGMPFQIQMSLSYILNNSIQIMERLGFI